MAQSAVDPGIGGDAQQVDFAVTGFGCGDRGGDRVVIEEAAVLDRDADANRFLVHDAAGPDVLVANFGIAHRPVGQTHVAAGGVDERGGVLFQQLVAAGGVGKLHGIKVVVLGVGVAAPAVADNKNNGFDGHGKAFGRSVGQRKRLAGQRGVRIGPTILEGFGLRWVRDVK